MREAVAFAFIVGLGSCRAQWGANASRGHRKSLALGLRSRQHCGVGLQGHIASAPSLVRVAVARKPLHFAGGPSRACGWQQFSVASLRPLPNTVAAHLAASQQKVAGRQSTWVWLWLGRLQITSRSTRTPRRSRPLRGRASWAPVISNVRPH
jgi:hypothetical protein